MRRKQKPLFWMINHIFSCSSTSYSLPFTLLTSCRLPSRTQLLQWPPPSQSTSPLPPGSGGAPPLPSSCWLLLPQELVFLLARPCHAATPHYPLPKKQNNRHWPITRPYRGSLRSFDGDNRNTTMTSLLFFFVLPPQLQQRRRSAS